MEQPSKEERYTEGAEGIQEQADLEMRGDSGRDNRARNGEGENQEGGRGQEAMTTALIEVGFN